MPLNDRVARLRQQSLEAQAVLSAERAQLITDFYLNQEPTVSKPVMRALAFKYIMEHKTIFIHPGELIVGERGERPKATPTYPEICCHDLSDLDVLDQREKTSFSVSEKARNLFRDKIIPYWKGRTLRERIFQEMTDAWKDAYHSGLYTEFMEQRAPGHTVLDDKIYHNGFLDFIKALQRNRKNLDFLNDREAYDKQEQLKAMEICAKALITYAKRHARKATALARNEADPVQRSEYERIAEICSRVPARAPQSFYEALQYYWFVHLGVITELNTWDAFNPGRLDQHLLPFYHKGLADGTLTQESAREFLGCFWIKFNNQPAPPKVGITAQESSTYTDFALINTGGVRTDGSDAVNELSYLILDVIEEMRLLQPSSCIQVSKMNPDRFVQRAAGIIRTGFGQPSIFNTDVIIQELTRQGKSIEDARDGGASGCVEAGAFGKENYNLTGYMNLPKILEITLNSGLDPKSGRQLGLKTKSLLQCRSFDELFEAFRKQLEHFVEIKIRGNHVIERLYAREMPAPFLSLLIDDCIARGRDYHDGGARYNTSYIQGVGLGTITDALTAVKVHLFEEKTFSPAELLQALENDFEGHEKIRRVLVDRTPKYGNDDDRADEVMRAIFAAYFNAVDGLPNTRGGTYRINLLPTTVHVYFGSMTGALPDGRRAGEPLSEGISPVQGADRKGPTAVLKSAAKIDHALTGGTLLNQKLTPHLLEGDEGLMRLVHLVRSYFTMDGHHIQFNVVDAATLRAAQTQPEKFRDLIVRVAGYSDYFCDLSKALQDEIILRTEHS